MKIFQRIKKSNGRTHIYICGIKIFSIKPNSFNGLLGVLWVPYINYRLQHCKYVHLMHNEKFTEATIQLFNNNFNPKDHLFLCASMPPFLKFPTAPNVIRLRSMKGLNFNQKNIEKIICHGLFNPKVLDWLYKHPNISREKCFWVIWGGDLYGEYGDPENDQKYLSIRQNFKGYVSAFDKQKACEMLHLDISKFYTAFVSCPISKEMIEKVHKEKHDYIQIQINHSCNKTTLEMLDILSKWKDKNIHVSTVLSYGDLSCIEQIKQKGKGIFGDRFSYLERMVTPQEYTQFLAQNDILILNHDRQQGMGNAFVALNFGTKLFIKSDVSTYHFFNEEEKIKVFDTYLIKNMTFDEFVAYPEKEKNSKTASKYQDEVYLAGLWRDVLNSN